MRYVILDPGGDTGWLVWDTAFGDYGQVLYAGQFEDDDHHLTLETMLQEQWEANRHELVIICERFDNRNNNDFAKLISLEYIGVVKLFKQKHSGVTVYFQGSSIIQSETNMRLSRIGLLIKPVTPNRHLNDACRHWCYFVINNKNAPPDLRKLFLERLKPNDT